MRADGSNPVGFFCQKWHFGAIWAILRARMVELYVWMAKVALGWQRKAFSGCSLGIRGFTHVSPYNPDVVGSPTASVFHSIDGQPPSSSCVEY